MKLFGITLGLLYGNSVRDIIERSFSPAKSNKVEVKKIDNSFPNDGVELRFLNISKNITFGERFIQECSPP